MEVDKVRVQQVTELNSLIDGEKQGRKNVEKKGTGESTKAPEPPSKEKFEASKAEALSTDVGGSKIADAAPETASAIRDVKKMFGQLVNSMFKGDSVKAPKASDLLVHKDSMESSGTVLSDTRSKGEVKTQSEVQGDQLLRQSSGSDIADQSQVVQHQQVQSPPPTTPTIG